MTDYALDFTCTNSATMQPVSVKQIYASRKAAHDALRVIVADSSCVKGTVDWSITVYQG